MPVVDASVVVDWVAPDSDAANPARQALVRWIGTAEPLTAPRVLWEEVGNALLSGIRRRRWSGAASDAAFAQLRRLPVALRDGPEDLLRAYELARRHDEHPLYDMVYVALAERTGQQLVSADARLVARTRLLGFVVGLDELTAG